jgi:hypothetical protein
MIHQARKNDSAKPPRAQFDINRQFHFHIKALSVSVSENAHRKYFYACLHRIILAFLISSLI